MNCECSEADLRGYQAKVAPVPRRNDPRYSVEYGHGKIWNIETIEA